MRNSRNVFRDTKSARAITRKKKKKKWKDKKRKDNGNNAVSFLLPLNNQLRERAFSPAYIMMRVEYLDERLLLMKQEQSHLANFCISETWCAYSLRNGNKITKTIILSNIGQLLICRPDLPRLVGMDHSTYKLSCTYSKHSESRYL